MSQIKNVQELPGKTIANAKLIDADESLALLFTDDTFAIVDVDFFGDSHSLTLSEEPNDYGLREAGVITKDEYAARQARREEERNAAREASERDLYERLKARFES